MELQLTPARRERLADILYGQLLEQIAIGRLDEGDRLPSEAEISRAFKVSRPVVREALMRLQADGLVYARRGAGTFVKRRPPARLTEFAPAASIAGYLRSFEARMAIEVEGARLAAGRRTDAQVARMRVALDALEGAFAAGRNGTEEDFAFHLAVADATGNDLFPALLQTIQDLVLGSMTVALKLTRLGSDERRERVLSEHRQIFDAIVTRDANAAALFMHYHLLQARNRTTDPQLHP